MKRILLLLTMFSAHVIVSQTQFQWAKSFGNSANESAVKLAVDSNDNVYIIGTFSGTVDFNPGSGIDNKTSSGGIDGYLVKLDSNGNYLWSINLGGTSDDYISDIVIDLSDNVYLVGNFQGTADFNPSPSVTLNTTSLGSTDIFILKLNAAGTYQFHRTIGGTSSDTATRLILDNSNVPIIIGTFQGVVDFDPSSGSQFLAATGLSDMYLLKLSNFTGGLLGVSKFDGTSNSIITPTSIFIDANNNTYLGGYFRGTIDFDPSSGNSSLTANNATNNSSFLLKLSSTNNLTWLVGLNSNGDVTLQDMKLDQLGNVVSTGSFTGTVDFDPSSGLREITSSATNTFIWKLDNNTNILYAGRFTGVNSNAGYALEIDSSNDIYITGFFTSNNVDFNPNSGFAYQSGWAGGNDVFITKILFTGAFGYAKRMGSTGNDDGFDILIKGSSLYTLGRFEGTSDFDPELAVSNLTSNGGQDSYVQKLSENSLGLEGIENFNFKLYPNPVNSNLNLKTGLSDFNYAIYTVEGKMVKQGKSNVPNTPVDVSSLTNGTYLMEIESNNIKTTSKLIKN